MSQALHIFAAATHLPAAGNRPRQHGRMTGASLCQPPGRRCERGRMRFRAVAGGSTAHQAVPVAIGRAAKEARLRRA